MADYLKDYQAELRKVGDVVFKSRHRSPFLIVIGRAAELVGESNSLDRTMVAAPSPEGIHAVALLHRVFPVTKAANAPRGPIRLGRSGENDIPIPEYSISKRQCYFDFDAEGVKIIDCGSTNGTFVGAAQIAPAEPVLIKDGTRIALGRFAFEFRTAVGFHAHVKSLLG
ncbi:MAG: FHA domain-containing protein [Deltaproteobacteria bacterium]|nr:FHA domain-containing protein [Deltaproteobacteria bacterium]